MTEGSIEDTDWICFEPSEHPRVSILITAWKDAPLLLRCLRSIAQSPSDIDYDVVVVLNAPTPRLSSSLGESVQGAQVVQFGVNIGFAAACNRGALLARGEYILLLNDDTEVEPGWLDALVKTADSDPGAGAVGSAMLTPDGVLAEAGAIVWRDGRVTAVTQAVAEKLGGLEEPRRVDYCSASSLLVRRTTWDSIGGFDERYFPAYYEDVDLCFEIARLGQGVLCDPRSKVRHRVGASSSSLYQDFMGTRNLQMFVDRWANELAQREPSSPDDIEALRRSIERAASAKPSSSEPPAPRSDRTKLRPRSKVELTRTDELSFLALELGIKDEYVSQLEHDRIERDVEIEKLKRARQSLNEEVAAWIAKCHELENAARAQENELRETLRRRDEAERLLDAFRSRTAVRTADRLASALHWSGARSVLRRVRQPPPGEALGPEVVAPAPSLNGSSGDHWYGPRVSKLRRATHLLRRIASLPRKLDHADESVTSIETQVNSLLSTVEATSKAHLEALSFLTRSINNLTDRLEQLEQVDDRIHE